MMKSGYASCGVVNFGAVEERPRPPTLPEMIRVRVSCSPTAGRRAITWTCAPVERPAGASVQACASAGFWAGRRRLLCEAALTRGLSEVVCVRRARVRLAGRWGREHAHQSQP